MCLSHIIILQCLCLSFSTIFYTVYIFNVNNLNNSPKHVIPKMSKSCTRLVSMLLLSFLCFYRKTHTFFISVQPPEKVNKMSFLQDEVTSSICECIVVLENNFLTVISCQCSYITYRWMTVLDAMPSEGLELTGVQFELALLPFAKWNSSKFLKLFNDIMSCTRRKPFQLFSGRFLLNIWTIFSHIWWQT